MPEDLMRYDQLAQNALRGVVREALKRVLRSGLPGEHHFFIAFNTRYPGVSISEKLLLRYPREMTIVLQHQYSGLTITEDWFSVVLYFDHVPETLVVPFNSIKGFLDPAVQFGLQFEAVPVNAEIGPEKESTESQAGLGATPAPLDAAEQSTDDAKKEKVISLDAFRKK